MSSEGSAMGSEIESADLFPSTHWTMVLMAGQNASPEATAALETLCRTYWYPLYVYIRRKGHGAEEAQDLTQEYFLRLLEKNYLAHVDRQKGRFRCFLLAALNHFLANEWRRGQTAKRGGGHPLIPLDERNAESRYALEPVSDLSPEKIYERHWALAVLGQALARLREESVAAGRTQQFDLLKGFLTTEAEEGDYDAAAVRLGMRFGTVAVLVHRLRQRYREMLRNEIARTVASQAEVEDEIRWLFAALG
jgi:DNA-directed RNA polymerase specialized sigma24 family protein